MVTPAMVAATPLTDSPFSPQWYRVCRLTPRLASHVVVQRNSYRGMIWFILDDRINNRTHRFNAAAYHIIGMMNGRRDVDTIWQKTQSELGDFAPTQDDVIDLLSQLHQADLLGTNKASDLDELFSRSDTQRQQNLKQRIGNPLAIRISLWDPNAFLNKHIRFISLLFHARILYLSFLFLIVCLLTLAIKWSSLSIYAAQSQDFGFTLVCFLLLYPIVKLLHELGHAFTAKHYGCEVHEMGITFLLFMPIPYVDVSSASLLRSAKQRMLIGAAGILVELVLAAVGLVIWLATEPGWIKHIGYSLLLIGGISSLLFNGNPLLKYDGYYILADGIGIPNLFQRSRHYLVFLLKKYVLGINTLTSPATSPGESSWFIGYGIASTFYRLLLIWIIALYLLEINVYLGAALVAWLAFGQIGYPLIKAIGFLLTSASLDGKRLRSITITLSTTTTLLACIFWMPLPSYTSAQGIVWMPDAAELRADADGFVTQVSASTGDTLSEGGSVIGLSEPELGARVTVIRSRLRELGSQYQSLWGKDRVAAQNIKEEMKVLYAELTEAEKRLANLVIRTKQTGTLIFPDDDLLLGKYLHKGDLVGFVVSDQPTLIKVAIPQTDIGKIQNHVHKVTFRLSSDIHRTLTGDFIRTIPEASHKLPSPALASRNGGPIAAEMTPDNTLRSFDKIFTVEVALPEMNMPLLIGQRAYVRFEHGRETLATQWYRSFRQTFLRRLHV